MSIMENHSSDNTGSSSIQPNGFDIYLFVFHSVYVVSTLAVTVLIILRRHRQPIKSRRLIPYAAGFYAVATNLMHLFDTEYFVRSVSLKTQCWVISLQVVVESGTSTFLLLAKLNVIALTVLYGYKYSSVGLSHRTLSHLRRLEKATSLYPTLAASGAVVLLPFLLDVVYGFATQQMCHHDAPYEDGSTRELYWLPFIDYTAYVLPMLLLGVWLSWTLTTIVRKMLYLFREKYHDLQSFFDLTSNDMTESTTDLSSMEERPASASGSGSVTMSESELSTMGDEDPGYNEHEDYNNYNNNNDGFNNNNNNNNNKLNSNDNKTADKYHQNHNSNHLQNESNNTTIHNTASNTNEHPSSSGHTSSLPASSSAVDSPSRVRYRLQCIYHELRSVLRVYFSMGDPFQFMWEDMLFVLTLCFVWADWAYSEPLIELDVTTVVLRTVSYLLGLISPISFALLVSFYWQYRGHTAWGHDRDGNEEGVSSMKDTFRTLLKDPTFRQLFYEYAKSEFSVENVLFYMEAIKFESMFHPNHNLVSVSKAKKILDKAHRIYDTYLSEDGIRSINTTLPVRQDAHVKIQAVQEKHADLYQTHKTEPVRRNRKRDVSELEDVFDDGIEQVIMNMLDTFARFEKSHLFHRYNQKFSPVQ